MKTLIDTTYLLPAIGISIKNLPKGALIKLIQEGHQIFASDISLFELSAKGAKFIASGTLTDVSVTRGIRAIVYSDTITITTMYESDILLTAFKLRHLLHDFVDCLILASAINRCDTLITEDDDITDLKKAKEFNELLQTLNPRFRIQTLAEIHD